MKPLKTVRNEQGSAGIETEIDQILATEVDLMPSSGFLASVMERVQEEAAAPPPIPFPWKRAVPGIVLAAGVFGWGAVELVRAVPSLLGSLTLSTPHLSAATVASLEDAGWVAAALGCSLVCWLFARRLAGCGRLM